MSSSIDLIQSVLKCSLQRQLSVKWDTTRETEAETHPCTDTREKRQKKKRMRMKNLQKPKEKSEVKHFILIFVKALKFVQVNMTCSPYVNNVGSYQTCMVKWPSAGSDCFQWSQIFLNVQLQHDNRKLFTVTLYSHMILFWCAHLYFTILIIIMRFSLFLMFFFVCFVILSFHLFLFSDIWAQHCSVL